MCGVRLAASLYVRECVLCESACVCFGYDLFPFPISKHWQVCEWIIHNTPPKAVFLSPDVHNHPASLCAGRTTLVSYPGHSYTRAHIPTYTHTHTMLCHGGAPDFAGD